MSFFDHKARTYYYLWDGMDCEDYGPGPSGLELEAGDGMTEIYGPGGEHLHTVYTGDTGDVLCAMSNLIETFNEKLNEFDEDTKDAQAYARKISERWRTSANDRAVVATKLNAVLEELDQLDEWLGKMPMAPLHSERSDLWRDFVDTQWIVMARLADSAYRLRRIVEGKQS